MTEGQVCTPDKNYVGLLVQHRSLHVYVCMVHTAIILHCVTVPCVSLVLYPYIRLNYNYIVMGGIICSLHFAYNYIVCRKLTVAFYIL